MRGVSDRSYKAWDEDSETTGRQAALIVGLSLSLPSAQSVGVFRL